MPGRGLLSCGLSIPPLPLSGVGYFSFGGNFWPLSLASTIYLNHKKHYGVSKIQIGCPLFKATLLPYLPA